METLYKHTPHNFYVYVIDQTRDGIDKALIDKYIHLYFRPRRNLGFAKATNMGILEVETPYFTMCNDDVEFIDRRWWQGVLDSFDKIDKATPHRLCVNITPSSIKLPDWSVGLPAGQDHYILPYKDEYSDEDWEFLIKEPHYVNKHFTIEPSTVIDGITMYCSVFKTERFLEVGLLDERYYPGGGEDYDWNCLANMKQYRSAGTTLSYVFHHWSKSFASVRDKDDVKKLVDPTLAWNQNHQKWNRYAPGDEEKSHPTHVFDLWGVKCPTCKEPMVIYKDNDQIARCATHLDQVYELPQFTQVPL